MSTDRFYLGNRVNSEYMTCVHRQLALQPQLAVADAVQAGELANSVLLCTY